MLVKPFTNKVRNMLTKRAEDDLYMMKALQEATSSNRSEESIVDMDMIYLLLQHQPGHAEIVRNECEKKSEGISIKFCTIQKSHEFHMRYPSLWQKFQSGVEHELGSIEIAKRIEIRENSIFFFGKGQKNKIVRVNRWFHIHQDAFYEIRVVLNCTHQNDKEPVQDNIYEIKELHNRNCVKQRMCCVQGDIAWTTLLRRVVGKRQLIEVISTERVEPLILELD